MKVVPTGESLVTAVRLTAVSGRAMVVVPGTPSLPRADLKGTGPISEVERAEIVIAEVGTGTEVPLVVEPPYQLSYTTIYSTVPPY